MLRVSLVSIAAFCLVPALSLANLAAATKDTLRYQSCDQEQSLKESPKRAISIDINTSEIMLALGLGSRLVAMAGIDKSESFKPELAKEAAHLPLLKGAYPSFESLIALRPDFIFAGWQYGFSKSTGLTPDRLKKFGIGSYALSESCVRVQKRPPISFQDIYTDIRTIAYIFGVEARAAALIAGFEKRIDVLKSRALTVSQKSRRIFLYDSGEASPFTAGKFGIPTAIIEGVGSKNIFDDLGSNWVGVSWEDVIRRQPEFIIIVDYGKQSADQKLSFLQEKFKGRGVSAIENGRFIVLPYAAVTPGIRSFEAAEQLQKALEKAFPEPRT